MTIQLPEGMTIYHKNRWDDYGGPDFHNTIEEAEACGYDRGEPILIVPAKQFIWLLGVIGDDHSMTNQEVWNWATREVGHDK